MKIALVVPGGVDRSGDRRVIPAFLWLLRRLARAHQVHVFAHRQEPRPACWPLEGAMVHNAAGSHWRLLRQLLAEHARGRFRCVQALFGGPTGLTAVIAARVLGLPVAVHLAGGELARLDDIRYGGSRHAAGRAREWLVMRGAHRLTAASLPIVAAARARGHEVRRLPLGVDCDEWPPVAPRARAPHEPLRLIHVASLNRVKDQSLLLCALAMAAERGLRFELDVVGEDTLHGARQRECHALGLASHVRFHGFLTQADTRALMLRAHLNLVSSRHEAGPLVLLEAAHCGVPTLGTCVGHLAEWAPDAAEVVATGSVRAFARALLALERDEARRLALAHQAQDRALAEDAELSARLFEDNLIDLCGASPRDAQMPGGQATEAAGATLPQRQHEPPAPARAP